MINRQRLLESFLRYVSIDSETKNEREFALVLEEELIALGGCVSFDNAGKNLGCNIGNLYARFEATAPGEPIILNAHMDTVRPGAGIRPIIEAGVIKTDGSTILGGDDKSGIAAVMETLRVIAENRLPHPLIEVVFTIHEEGGVCGSKLLEFERLESKRALVLDSSGAPGKIICAAPGQSKLYFTIHGRTAHAGVAPENGISAIQVAAQAIVNMRLLRIDAETTANIGEIEAKFSTNIVPDTLRLIAEVRSRDQKKLDEQVRHMEACVRESCEQFGASYVLDKKDFYSGYTVDIQSAFLESIKAACSALELPIVVTQSGGGSDANHFNHHGIEAVPMGTGMDRVHTTAECLQVVHLEQITALVLKLTTN